MNKNQKDQSTGFIARSAINPKLILCTDDQFHAEQFVCVNSWNAKVFKTEKGAINANNRTNIAVRVIKGVEQA